MGHRRRSVSRPAVARALPRLLPSARLITTPQVLHRPFARSVIHAALHRTMFVKEQGRFDMAQNAHRSMAKARKWAFTSLEVRFCYGAQAHRVSAKTRKKETNVLAFHRLARAIFTAC